VKAQVGTSEEWIDVKEGVILKSNTVLFTNNGSSVELSNGKVKFVLNESSVLPVNSIKKLTLDEMLLALAMEDILNVPQKKNKSETKTTAVYGTEEKEKLNLVKENGEFGLMRLNGAKQLAESGFRESALVNAKETYRKYPTTKENTYYRIYFANILYDYSLYDEALEEFNSIKNLKLNGKEKQEVNSKIDELNKRLLTK
jgi:hypothetical protein